MKFERPAGDPGEGDVGVLRIYARWQGVEFHLQNQTQLTSLKTVERLRAEESKGSHQHLRSATGKRRIK